MFRVESYLGLEDNIKQELVFHKTFILSSIMNLGIFIALLKYNKQQKK
jgi:hypothetical protein